jgi:hypothetical protein
MANYVKVQIYNATIREEQSLTTHLRRSEATESITYSSPTGKRKAAKAAREVIEAATIVYVHILPVLGTYAANKLLDIVYDRAVEWFRKHGKEGHVIKVTKGRKKKVIGKRRRR